jgi:hypothetical protein
VAAESNQAVESSGSNPAGEESSAGVAAEDTVLGSPHMTRGLWPRSHRLLGGRVVRSRGPGGQLFNARVSASCERLRVDVVVSSALACKRPRR